jgi:hypothetical protein
LCPYRALDQLDCHTTLPSFVDHDARNYCHLERPSTYSAFDRNVGCLPGRNPADFDASRAPHSLIFRSLLTAQTQEELESANYVLNFEQTPRRAHYTHIPSHLGIFLPPFAPVHTIPPYGSPPTVLPTDLRPDVLQLFQGAFLLLVSAPSDYEVNLRGTLALTALQELENLFPARRPDGAREPWTHDNHVNTLVRKDSLWYQCTVLHVLFAPRKDCWTLGSTARADVAMSERSIVDALSRILSRCRMSQDFGSSAGRPGTCNAETPGDGPDIQEEIPRTNLDCEISDNVGYNMILGVTEQYWRWTEDIKE